MYREGFGRLFQCCRVLNHKVQSEPVVANVSIFSRFKLAKALFRNSARRFT